MRRLGVKDVSGGNWGRVSPWQLGVFDLGLVWVELDWPSAGDRLIQCDMWGVLLY